jgi:hypothetical protein
MLVRMSDDTRLLDAAATEDSRVADDLLPLAYDELRRLADARLAAVAPGQTSKQTALVRETYLRLVGGAQTQNSDCPTHFNRTTAEAMLRILLNRICRKGAYKHD